MKTGLLILFAIIILLGSACSPSLYSPNEQDAARTGVSLDTLKAGRSLYVEKCGSCHNLYLPNKFSAQQWQIELSKMQKKAKINNEQKDLINIFLINSQN